MITKVERDTHWLLDKNSIGVNGSKFSGRIWDNIFSCKRILTETSAFQCPDDEYHYVSPLSNLFLHLIVYEPDLSF